MNRNKKNIRMVVFAVPICSAPGKIHHKVNVTIPVEVDEVGDELMTEEGTKIVHQTQLIHEHRAGFFWRTATNNTISPKIKIYKNNAQFTKFNVDKTRRIQ